MSDMSASSNTNTAFSKAPFIYFDIFGLQIIQTQKIFKQKPQGINRYWLVAQYQYLDHVALFTSAWKGTAYNSQ